MLHSPSSRSVDPFYLQFAIGRVIRDFRQLSFNALGSTHSISKDEVRGRFCKTVLNPHSAPWFPIDVGESLKLLQPWKDEGRAYNCKFL
jgi:hypothetical protein